MLLKTKFPTSHFPSSIFPTTHFPRPSFPPFKPITLQSFKPLRTNPCLRFSIQPLKCSVSGVSKPTNMEFTSNPKPFPAEVSRTIMELSSAGTFSSLSQEGWPLGFGTRFAVDLNGTPILCLNESNRKRFVDKKCSLHVQLEQSGLRMPQCTIHGNPDKPGDGMALKRRKWRNRRTTPPITNPTRPQERHQEAQTPPSHFHQRSSFSFSQFPVDVNFFPLRASSPLRKCIHFTKPTLFRRFYTFIARLHYIKVQHDHRLFNLYHSLAQIQRTPGFLLPRLDYTLKQDVAKTNWMITKLCKEGQISEARKSFDEMPDPDVISWTALISGYIRCGMLKEARELFDRVDAKKNVVTWTAMISGYVKMKRIFEAERLFEEMPEKNVISWNTMIDGYVQSDRIENALGLFKRMDERNVVSWNTVIAGLVNYGRMKDARGLFDRMPQRDVISWTIMISGLAREGRIEEARVFFDTMTERNVVSWNAMITGYTQNMRLDEAFDLFKRMSEKDVPSWNTMIAGFIQNKDLERARKLFDEMPRKNVVSWTAMINGYVQDGQSEEALRTFFHMKKDSKVNPNEGTFVSVLGACSDLAGLGEGKQVHQVISKTVYQESEFVISALINMYSKCGELVMARKMFEDGLKGKRDLVSWNTMIAAYSHHGCGREAIKVFKEMQNIGIKPDDATYGGLLSACSHAGLVEQGLKYFYMLLRDEGIEVRDDHYTCLVDLCGRAGRLKEAYDLVEQLPNKASTSVWGALLAGCNIHGDEDVGKLAANKLLDMEPENAGTYMLLSNIYASSGKWEEAAFQRLKMKEKGLKKQPGCSWIEVGNRFHVFVVGDKSHTESKIMHLLLFNLHKKMKKMGSIPLHDMIMEEGFFAI